MMELRTWLFNKINMTDIDNECKDNVLSRELLKILNIQDPEKKKELCVSIAKNTSTLIHKVIVGLAQK